jgi:hypothetical protein
MNVVPFDAETWPIIEHQPEHIPDVPPDMVCARLRPPSNRVPSPVDPSRSTPFIDVPAGFRLKVTEEDGMWIVVDSTSGIFGSGFSPSEAIDDFKQAARDHLELLECQDRLAEPLQRQLAYLRSRVH